MTYSYYQKKEASRDRRPSGSVARATAAQRVAAVRSGAQAARCRPESGRRQLLLKQKQRALRAASIAEIDLAVAACAAGGTAEKGDLLQAAKRDERVVTN